MTMLIYVTIKICNRCPTGFIRRRSPNDGNAYIQIFNKCFDNSSRRRTTQVAIPVRDLDYTTACVTDDEDNVIVASYSKIRR
uniref:SFRICE_041068 n=1 Tax=Spodoptera frugiperda TaxID=7108 RepID=A0A2H1WMY1_SPOFR